MIKLRHLRAGLFILLLATIGNVHARFVSVDPVKPDTNNGQNFNRYHYGNNNPYKFTDPDGRQTIPLANRIGTDDPKIQQAFFTHQGDQLVSFLTGTDASSVAPPGSGAVQSAITPMEVGLASSLARGGAALGSALRAGEASSATTPLFRAVSPAEAADLASTNGAFRNPAGIEVKYFSTSAEGAASYANQTVGTPLYQGPYSIVQSAIPTNSITPLMQTTVDRGVQTIVVPTELLPSLRPAVPVR